MQKLHENVIGNTFNLPMCILVHAACGGIFYVLLANEKLAL